MRATRETKVAPVRRMTTHVRRKSTPRGGFTLVELLVVVSIIVLLISILAPNMQRALDVARRTQCGANMQTFAKAMTGYSSANSGRFVSCMEWVRNTEINYGDPGWSWGVAWPNPYAKTDDVLRMGKLWPYILEARVYVCPVYAELAYPHKGDPNYGLQYTYSMNGHISHLWAQNPDQRKEWYQMVTDMRHPSKVFLLSEEMPWPTSGHCVAGLNDGVLRGENYEAGYSRGDALGYMHGDGTVENGSCNAVFADGHVRKTSIWQTYDVTFDPP